jgi:hypothetical protein
MKHKMSVDVSRHPARRDASLNARYRLEIDASLKHESAGGGFRDFVEPSVPSVHQDKFIGWR